VDDVLSDHRQRELAELVRHLGRYRPTEVCVEAPSETQHELDEAFARFVSGEMEPRRDEIAQIGFRLARDAGLPGVHAIDDRTPMRWDAWRASSPGLPTRIGGSRVGWIERSGQLKRSRNGLRGPRFGR